MVREPSERRYSKESCLDTNKCDTVTIGVGVEQGTVEKHCHSHEELTLVLTGCFEFVSREETQRLRAGEAIIHEAHTPHTVTCIEAGMIVDSFIPGSKERF
ncbi:cupin domain-containing protein [Vibrio cionasavignyae]|uniref:cupin domain-containing protein n=1 Tax=Vibrio cionasavignyae TaxID=2910252 RepID=UPI003D0F263E